jgi:hypothetical protein
LGVFGRCVTSSFAASFAFVSLCLIASARRRRRATRSGAQFVRPRDNFQIVEDFRVVEMARCSQWTRVPRLFMQARLRADARTALAPP